MCSGSADDAADLAELGLALDVAVRAQQDGDCAHAVERRDHGERRRPGLHEDADVLSLMDAEGDEPANDRVDPVLRGGVGMRAVLEEEEHLVRMLLCLLVEDLAKRDAGARAYLVQANQAWELRHGLLAKGAKPGCRAGDAGHGRAREVGADSGGEA